MKTTMSQHQGYGSPTTVCLTVLLVGFVCLVSLTNACGETGIPRPELSVPFCTQPPKVDGTLNDECWKSAAHAEKFFRLTSPVAQQTEAWVCADKSHLYIAFHCLDSQPNSIREEETQRNGNTFVDDYVAVDIDSQGSKVNSSQFIVTARGTQNENLEGGTADNITWAGDWKAAVTRVSDGWDVEMSIPFALLRYPKDTHQFGIQFERKLAREVSFSYWPDRPAVSQSNPIEYYGVLTNISPTFYRPQPIFLPYALLSAGQGTSERAGIDIKYPLTTGLTGLLTYHPDFATVEQNVTNINFSYSQHFISDQRPFFAEGSGFFPYSDIFYSPTIGVVDEGAKITGKQNGTAVGALAVYAHGANFQKASVVSFTHDLNPLSNIEVDYAGNDQAGIESGDVVKTQAAFGEHFGRDILQAYITHSFSWLGGQQAGNQDYYKLQLQGHPGHPSITYENQGVESNFNTELGFEPNYDFQGPHYSFEQTNKFDNGTIRQYDFFASWIRQDHWHGGFFQDSATSYLYLQTHNGNGAYYQWTQGRRMEFRDHIDEFYVEWSDFSAYGGGSLDYQAGTQADQRYRWYSLNQGYGFSQKASVNLTVNWQDLGSTITSQIVFTPNYKLTSERSIGGRIVAQNNKTDVYLTFAQKSRSGSDIFLIFGDPNSLTTKGLVELKVVTPF